VGVAGRATEAKERRTLVSTLSQYASLITAALAIFAAAATLSTPADTRAGMRSLLGLRYNVAITSPTDSDAHSCPTSTSGRPPKPVMVRSEYPEEAIAVVTLRSDAG
jgi:hypothetical protein